MTISERRSLEAETDIEYLESRISAMQNRIGKLLSIEEIFTQDSRGVRAAFSRQQIAENRTLAAELYEDIEQYEERISALRAEEQAMAHAA